MVTAEGLMPKTRVYLAHYYDKYPLPPLPGAAVDLAARLRALSADLAAVNPATPDLWKSKENGPALYTLTKLVLAIRLYFHVSLARYGQRKIEKDDIAVLQQAMVIYTEEFEKFLRFIGLF